MSERPSFLIVGASSHAVDIDVRALGWQRAETAARWINPVTRETAKYAFGAGSLHGRARGTVLVKMPGWAGNPDALTVVSEAERRGLWFHIVGPEFLEQRRGR